MENKDPDSDQDAKPPPPPPPPPPAPPSPPPSPETQQADLVTSLIDMDQGTVEDSFPPTSQVETPRPGEQRPPAPAEQRGAAAVEESFLPDTTFSVIAEQREFINPTPDLPPAGGQGTPRWTSEPEPATPPQPSVLLPAEVAPSTLTSTVVDIDTGEVEVPPQKPKVPVPMSNVRLEPGPLTKPTKEPGGAGHQDETVQESELYQSSTSHLISASPADSLAVGTAAAAVTAAGEDVPFSRLSPLRKIAFVVSLFACAGYVAVFAVLLPCVSEEECPRNDTLLLNNYLDKRFNVLIGNPEAPLVAVTAETGGSAVVQFSLDPSIDQAAGSRSTLVLTTARGSSRYYLYVRIVPSVCACGAPKNRQCVVMANSTLEEFQLDGNKLRYSCLMQDFSQAMHFAIYRCKTAE